MICCFICLYLFVVSYLISRLQISKLSELHVFAVCTACLLPALLCQVRLLNLTADNVDSLGTAAAGGSAQPTAHADKNETDTGMRQRAKKRAPTTH